MASGHLEFFFKNQIKIGDEDNYFNENCQTLFKILQFLGIYQYITDK